MQRGKPILAIAVVLIAIGAPAQEPAAALLNRAAAVLPAGPLLVRGNVVLYAAQKLNGDYSLAQSDAGHWREQVQFPGYAEIRVANAPKLLVSRNVGPQPLSLWALFLATHPQAFLQTGPQDHIAPPKKRKIRGRPATCVRITAGESREVCLDSASSALLTVNTGPGLSYEYEYASPGNSAFPSAIRISERAHRILDANLAIDRSGAPAPDWSAPASSREFGWCADQVPATTVDKKPPHYPESARQNRLQGTSAVYAVIETDGSLSDLALVQSAGKDLDQATMDAVRQWRYRPATCAGVPVRVETVISVNYSLSP